MCAMKSGKVLGHDYCSNPFKISTTPLEAVENLADRFENVVRDGQKGLIEADAIRHHLRELVGMLMARDHYELVSMTPAHVRND